MTFYDGSSDRHAFSIGFAASPQGDFGVYARGYFFAAECLSRSLLERISFADYEAYPVVFLFRHSLELSLKNVIYSCARLAWFKDLKGIPIGWNNSHNLEALFAKSEAALRMLFPHDDSLCQFLRRVGEVVKDFSALDSSSYAFRYPIDTKGASPFSTDISISLQTMLDTMTEVFDGLDAIDFGLDSATAMLERDREELAEFLAAG